MAPSEAWHPKTKQQLTSLKQQLENETTKDI